jgi:hypothetical protein
LFVENYTNELTQNTPGYCMKVTGLSLDKLQLLYPMVKALNPSLHTYILSEAQDDEKYITATKLIELRNDLNIALLVLIPINSRTSAEDSYGDATFKDLSVFPIDNLIYKQLMNEIPDIYKSNIAEIFEFLKDRIRMIDKIQYLLYQTIQEYTEESIGNGIYLFELIPDPILLENKNIIRKRLSYNIQCSEELGDFTLSFSERIQQLPIKKDTLQQEIAKFLQAETYSKTKEELCNAIAFSYPNLNFANWQIPEIHDSNQLIVTADIIPGKELVKNKEEGGYTLFIQSGKKATVKLRIYTDPIPKESKDLKNLRILLMDVDGMYPIGEVKKAKVTEGTRAYRDISIDIADGQYENGSYFFHVVAEDEHGTILNQEDPFRQETIQRQWETEKQKDESLTKTQFQTTYRVLLTSDTESFYLQSTEEEEEGTPTRKAKIDNLLQAYFHYRIEEIRKGKELDNPDPQHAEWIESNIFHIQYNSSHNYQIILSKKLLEIERALLNHSESLGALSVGLSGSPTDNTLQSIQFNPLSIDIEIDNNLLEKRKELFAAIKNSVSDNTGVIETFDLFNHVQLVKEYLIEYNEWISDINQVQEDKSISTSIQMLDAVSLDVEMPDGSRTILKMITPLHPLRLAWLVNLFDLFEEWEIKSVECSNHRKEWLKNLDNLFYGKLVPDIAPLVLADSSGTTYYQYTGELTFGWGLLADPSKNNADVFANNYRQIKSYVTSLLNIASERRIDSDINQALVYRHLKNFIKQHPYTNKLVINIFNPGDAAVFAQTMIELEREGYDLNYEVRLFAEDKLILPGESLRDLLNPETQISEEAESFSQATENRLFPKLRFSINDTTDFIKNHSNFQAHLSFLINPFPSETVLLRVEKDKQSFFLNGIINRPIVEVVEKDNEYLWNKYFADNALSCPVNEFANVIVNLFTSYQLLISNSLSSNREQSIPALCLQLGKNDQTLLSMVHDVSDWVVTFDKNMGPEFYDLPCIKEDETPYLLDYVPSQDMNGISSFLTTRPTSEIEGLMVPLFKNFNIDVSNDLKFKELLEDLRSVGSSLIMQVNSTKNKAFEVVGITFMKRMLQKKGLLDNAFLIPIDLHKELFEMLKTDNKERADNLLVDVFPEKREIVFTIIEIKCRKSLGQQEKEDLQDKMHSQIVNTIEAIRAHFDTQYDNDDRLDRELKTIELQSILLFYLQRAKRYGNISQESYEAFTHFISELHQGYNLRFKNLGVIFDFSAPIRIAKEYLNETTFYLMGSKAISEIIDDNSKLNTKTKEKSIEDKEFSDFFETSERITPKMTDKKSESIEIPKLDSPQKEKKSHPIMPIPDIDVTPKIIVDENYKTPSYDITIGKTSDSAQYGILGKTITGNRSIAIDLSETNTISLFGVQGGGKSYTIGTISEMVLKQFSNINKLPAPLASVIFHYSESMDYAPEFTSMISPNDDGAQLKKLKEVYGAEPGNIEDIVLLVPADKLELRKVEYPSIKVYPISFNSSELNVQDWMFLLGAVGNDSTYIRQLKTIMRSIRNDISLQTLRNSVTNSNLLTNSQKSLAEIRLNFAEEYIDDSNLLKSHLKPGRLVIVDLRDELIAKEEALGLFVVMLNIFSNVKEINGLPFNKFIVFDEAHKYMNNSDLTDSIVTAIREMRHKGVSMMIASQDPMSLPNAIIELSSIVLLHKFNSPQWVKHVQKSITQLSTLTSTEMASLSPGEAYLWATKSTDKNIMNRPIKISTRPRVTKHGGDTIKAI